MSTSTLHPPAHPHVSVTGPREWGFGALALAWYALSTFASLGLPNFVTVLILGGLVALSVQPDSSVPQRGIGATRWNLVIALLAASALVPVAVGMDLLLGRIPIESGHAVLASFAALCVVLPRLAKSRQYAGPAALGHRELILAVTALVAFARSAQAGDIFLSMVLLAVIAPVVMAFRRIRSGSASPRLLRRPKWALQALNVWLCLALLGAAGLTGTFFVWRILAPDAYELIVWLFFGGLAAIASLTAFPRRRVSVAANVLVALGSVFLATQLVRIDSRPADPVSIGVPFTEEWDVASGGRSTLVNGHWSLKVQRNAIDFVQLVDGKTYRGDRSRLENFHIFGDPLLAVAAGRVTAAVDSRPDLPIGERTWHEMAGNHVILDIGGGHYVLYGHLKQGSVRVHAGDRVRRGQRIGQVGDSGNSDEPHLHIQVQNEPGFDVERRSIETYPIVLEHASTGDLRRADSVRPLAGS